MLSANAKNLSILQIIFVILAILGLFVFEFTWINVLCTILGYFLYSGIGVSMTMHRYFSHKSFEFKNSILAYICTFFAILAGRGSPLGWVYVHRMHHMHADMPKDPHNPVTAKWRIFFPHLLKYGETINKRIIIDMLTKSHLNINKYYMLYIVVWSILLMMISPTVFYFCYVLPFVFTFIALDLFVLLSHTYGYRNFDTKDMSKNNWFISLILWGEGWHNNHHHNSKNYTTSGDKFFEIDLLKYVIRLVGVVSK